MSSDCRKPLTTSIEYEPTVRVGWRRRRRRWQWIAVFAALAFSVLLVLASRDEIRSRYAKWQRDRKLRQAMDVPSEQRFPPGEVIYEVAAGSHTNVVPPGTAVYGPVSAWSAKATAEFNALTIGYATRAPMLFLGRVTDAAGRPRLIAIAFRNCAVRGGSGEHDVSDIPSGYYVSLSFLWVESDRYGYTESGVGTRLAPLSAVDWKFTWEDEHWAALPLTFYSGFIDPLDSRFAVLPFKLGSGRGTLRVSLDARNEPITEATWEK